MPFLPTPRVTIDGQTIACTAPGGTLGDDVTIMAPLSIDWGRDDPWSQPDPATMTVTLWDPHGEWAARLRGGSAIDRVVTVFWSKDGHLQTIFRGHTAAAKVERSGHRIPSGDEYGWWVHLTCADLTAPMANTRLARFRATEFMNMSTVYNALRTAAQTAGVAEVYLESKTRRIAPPDAGTDLDLLSGMYESEAVAFGYRPDLNAIYPLQRAALPAPVAGYLMPQGGSTALHIVGGTLGAPMPGLPAPRPVALDGCRMSSDGRAAFDQATMINTVTVSYPKINYGDDAAAEVTFDTVELTVANVPAGRRAQRMTFKTWDRDNPGAWATRALARAQDEASRPTHPRVLFSTRHDGGFTSPLHAKTLTLPAETLSVLWLNGSEFVRWCSEWAPAFQARGGRISFDGEHWDIEISLGWFGGAPLTSSATWASMAPTITWHNEAAPHLADAVTWWDTRHIATGTIYAETT